MRRSIGTHQACPVEREDNRKVLQRNLLENLVERALKEGAVNVYDRLGARLGHATRKGDGVALADAGIEELVRERLANLL